MEVGPNRFQMSEAVDAAFQEGTKRTLDHGRASGGRGLGKLCGELQVREQTLELAVGEYRGHGNQLTRAFALALGGNTC